MYLCRTGRCTTLGKLHPQGPGLLILTRLQTAFPQRCLDQQRVPQYSLQQAQGLVHWPRDLDPAVRTFSRPGSLITRLLVAPATAPDTRKVLG